MTGQVPKWNVRSFALLCKVCREGHVRRCSVRPLLLVPDVLRHVDVPNPEHIVFMVLWSGVRGITAARHMNEQQQQNSTATATMCQK
eukprot:scaffold27497_cov131-Isochrysis_galbana.AAC.6